MYLTDLATAARKSGLKVVEIPGWQTRGRPGTFAPKGILCHHTAGPNDGYDDAYYMAVKGRPDLKAPLAQLALGRDGTVYVLAAGRANHAGRCKPIGGLVAYPGRDYGDGNAQLLGIEAMNRGTDAEDWTPVQYGAYVRLVAALRKHYGWGIVFGHKETSTSGKPDPDFPMDPFRRDVAAAMSNSDNFLKEDDMPDPRDLWAYTYKGRQALSYLVTADTNARAARADAAAALAIVRAQAEKGAALTADEVKRIVDASLDEKIDDAVTVLGVRADADKEA